MYADIASNRRRSILLILAFVVILLALGWAFGVWMGDVYGGLAIAAIVSLVMTLIGYYKGDAVALATAGAKQVSKADAPELYRLVENLAIADGLPTPKVYLVDDPSPNAFATGRDPKHASIAVTTGLLS